MAEPRTVYNTGFYEGLREGSRRSAQRIVPLVLQLLDVKSVADVGCGVGTWLRVFLDCGVTDIMGVDGDYVDTATIEIPPGDFKACDLQKPLRLDRCFDLVVSLEVAEHIPPALAMNFVESLTLLGPVVLFSGAVPFQNGNNHLNEQWPEYWAERFARRGYVAVDCIRRKIWNDEEVEPWYAQNAILFVKEDRLAGFANLARARAETQGDCLAMVHPKIYFKARYEAQLATVRTIGLDHIPVKKIIGGLPRRLARAVINRLRGRTVEPLPTQVAHPSAVPISQTRSAELTPLGEPVHGSR